MKTAATLLLLALATTSTAEAQTFVSTDVHRGPNGFSIDTTITRGGIGGMVAQPQFIERHVPTAASKAAWLERCKPTDSDPDRYGVVHVIYAAPGCQFGPR